MGSSTSATEKRDKLELPSLGIKQKRVSKANIIGISYTLLLIENLKTDLIITLSAYVLMEDEDNSLALETEPR